jgi:hypothetical protein
MAKFRNRKGSFILNLLTIAIMLATLAVAAVYALIFINPEMPFNPFPPPGDSATRLPQATETDSPSVFLPPTWTATIDPRTSTPTVTRTPRPSATPTDTPVPSITPTVDENATQAPFSATYILQANSPSYTSNFANGQACSWLGVAGQVFDLDGAPLTGISVYLSGTLAAQDVDLFAESGTADAYGPSGFEFTLGSEPVASSNTLWIQVYDQEQSQPLSEKIFFSTFNDCDRNLILVNWNQIR